MRVIDPGHEYWLETLDSPSQYGEISPLRFVKRMGPEYPGNESAYSGTTMQEVLRALIDRCHYINAQTPCPETEAAIGLFEAAIVLFETRAARRHGRALDDFDVAKIVYGPVCSHCLHVGCEISVSKE